MKEDAAKIIYIKDVKIKVIFKKVKSLRLTVHPDASVVLTIPEYTSLDKGVNFALSKYEWLVKRVNQAKRRPIKKERKYIDGEKFYVLGKEYALKLKTGEENLAFLDEVEHTLVVKTTKTMEKNLKKIIFDFYLSNLKFIIETFLPKWINLTGFIPSAIKYKNLKSVWGKCDYKTKEITFALQLLSRTQKEIEYVLMHELCHLSVPNHGKNFKMLESCFMPDWREVKKALKNNIFEYSTVL